MATPLKNWAEEAAMQIATEVYETSGPDTGINVNEMQAIIEACSPFKPNVAYMPVPRCGSCRYWVGHHCHRLVDSSGLRHGSKAVAVEDNAAGLFALLMTDADFGCVQHEEKK